MLVKVGRPLGFGVARSVRMRSMSGCRARWRDLSVLRRPRGPAATRLDACPRARLALVLLAARGAGRLRLSGSARQAGPRRAASDAPRAARPRGRARPGHLRLRRRRRSRHVPRDRLEVAGDRAAAGARVGRPLAEREAAPHHRRGARADRRPRAVARRRSATSAGSTSPTSGSPSPGSTRSSRVPEGAAIQGFTQIRSPSTRRRSRSATRRSPPARRRSRAHTATSPR